MSDNERPSLFRDMVILWRGMIAFILNPAMYYWIGTGWLMAAIVLWQDKPTPGDLAAGGGTFIMLAGITWFIVRYMGFQEFISLYNDDDEDE